MHAARNAHPWLGCKGADTITILKWLRFYTGLQREQPGWSLGDREVLWWMLCGAKSGLAFSRGIHGHGIWLAPSCVAHCRRSLQKFADSYAYLAHHCLQKNGPCLAWSPRSMLGFTSALTWMTARMIQGTKLWIQQPLIVAWLKILLEKSVGIVAASLSGILSGNCCNLTWWKPKLLSIGSWRITVWNSSFNLSGSEAWAGKNGPPVHRARPNSCS